jgi:hypothetical protein
MAKSDNTLMRETLTQQISRLPRRIEYLGGQRTSYVQLDNVLAVLEDFGVRVAPLMVQADLEHPPSRNTGGESIPILKSPIPLDAEQEQAIKQWAADDRLWMTQETVEFNLRTFARVILRRHAADVSESNFAGRPDGAALLAPQSLKETSESLKETSESLKETSINGD